jgi:hypothetical protein
MNSSPADASEAIKPNTKYLTPKTDTTIGSIIPRGPPASELVVSGQGSVVSEGDHSTNHESLITNHSQISPKEICFLDSTLQSYFQPKNADFPGVVVEVLSAESDGTQQISDILSGYRDLSAIHIVSHGASGQVSIGTGIIDTASLDDYANALGTWGDALTQDGDILFYGCAVAQGQTGFDLVDQIANLTDADIAASTDDTGAATLGGDWILEYETGSIETNLNLDTDGYNSILAVYAVDGGVNDDDASENGVITISTAQTISPASEPYTFETTDGGPVDVQIVSGGSLILEADSSSGEIAELHFGGNLVIQAGGSINADGKGYESDSGPGHGSPTTSSGSGGGYGGIGGQVGEVLGGDAYGSLTEPLDLGSGGRSYAGGLGGSGGGAIRLTVSGILQVDGNLTADGGDGAIAGTGSSSRFGGGGSGGSIYVVAGELTGTGSISADGGSSARHPSYHTYFAGGGGGGRIAVYYDTNTYTGAISATGGLGWYNKAGGAGTAYTKSTAQTYGQLLIDNDGNPDGETPLAHTAIFDDLTVKNAAVVNVATGVVIASSEGTITGASLNLGNSSTLDVMTLVLNSSGELVNFGSVVIDVLTLDSGTIANNGDLAWSTTNFLPGTNILTNSGTLGFPDSTLVNLSLCQNGVWNLPSDSLSIGDSGTLIMNVPFEIGDLTIDSGGILTHSHGEDGLDITVTRALIVDEGGRIDVSGRGYGSDSGPGAGESNRTGGGYGGVGQGYGQTVGGAAYGSLVKPGDLGSGGGSTYEASGGAGGGAILLTVSGTLRVDGEVTADGEVGSNTGSGMYASFGGSGSGGSIYLSVGELAGTGVISANGGDSPVHPSYGTYFAGGGGGGRIAIFYSTNTYMGTISAFGGLGLYDNAGGGWDDLCEISV